MHSVRFSPLAAAALALATLASPVLRADPAPFEPGTLDLKAAIGYALQGNYAIRQARERIKQQEGIVVEVTARAIPNIAATGAYQRGHGLGMVITQRLTATQTLFAGGGVRSSVKSADLSRESALLDLKAVINDALLGVRTAYYGVLLAREKIVVQEKNLELLQQQLKNVTNRYEAGTVSSFDKLRAEVAVANAQVPLITARNDYRLAIESLRQSLGFTTDKSGDVRHQPTFAGTLAYTPATFDLQTAFDAAQANRPDLQRLAKLSAARAESVTTAKANYYPTLQAFGGWQLRKGFTNSYSDSNDGWLVGVQSNWALFDGRATAGRVAQARSVLEQAKLSLTEAELDVEVEVRRAFSTWQEATELADASKKVVEQAEEAVRLATARYDAGTATQLDVLQAQVDLTTARTNQLQAYYSYNIAVATLRKAMGLADEFVTN